MFARISFKYRISSDKTDVTWLIFAVILAVVQSLLQEYFLHDFVYEMAQSFIALIHLRYGLQTSHYLLYGGFVNMIYNVCGHLMEL